MTKRIERVAVVGAGVMGAAIAAHFVNAQFLVDLLDIVLQTLAGAGVRAEGARNGAEALQAIRATRPAVILLDLMMPVMDGWECYRRIRADDLIRDLPVVIFSGDHAVAKKAAELGAADALSKPVSTDRLLAVIRRYLPNVPLAP